MTEAPEAPASQLVVGVIDAELGVAYWAPNNHTCRNLLTLGGDMPERLGTVLGKVLETLEQSLVENAEAMGFDGEDFYAIELPEEPTVFCGQIEAIAWLPSEPLQRIIELLRPHAGYRRLEYEVVQLLDYFALDADRRLGRKVKLLQLGDSEPELADLLTQLLEAEVSGNPVQSQIVLDTDNYDPLLAEEAIDQS